MRLAVVADHVVDDAGLDAVGDLLGLVGDGDHDPELALGVLLPVDPLAPHGHRPVGVGDFGRELGRVEVGRLAAGRQATCRRRSRPSSSSLPQAAIARVAPSTPSAAIDRRVQLGRWS